jgi:hypothetical protein
MTFCVQLIPVYITNAQIAPCTHFSRDSVPLTGLNTISDLPNFVSEQSHGFETFPKYNWWPMAIPREIFKSEKVY